MTRALLGFFTTLVATCLTIGCEDPQIAERDRTERQIREGGAKIAQAARLASTDRVAAAETLRSAGSNLSRLSNATGAQKQAAAGLASGALTQAALLEIGRADQLESENRAARSVAAGLLSVLDQLHLAASLASNDTAAGDFGSYLSDASAARSELDDQREQLEAQVATLQAAGADALARAQELLDEAEVIRQRAASAGPGEITQIAEEAAQQRDLAIPLQAEASTAESTAAIQQSLLRVRTAEAAGAATRVEAIERAVESLARLGALRERTAESSAEMAAEIGSRIDELLSAADPEADAGLTGCTERSQQDLENARNSSQLIGGQSSVSFQIQAAIARSLLNKGQSEFQHALLLHALAESEALRKKSGEYESKANSWLAKAQASTQSAIEAYTELQTMLSSGGESEAKRALGETVTRALQSITKPTFEVSAAPATAKAAKAETSAEPSANAKSPPSDTASPSGPPFDSAEALAAFMSDPNKDPAAMAAIDEFTVAETDEGRQIASILIAPMRSMGALQVAMRDKFGSANLGPMKAALGGGGQVSVVEATDSAATLEIRSQMGALTMQAARTDNGWKLDMDATHSAMPDQVRMQLMAAQGIIGPLLGAMDSVRQKVESGEISDAAQVQAALGMAMQRAMGGMRGGPPSGSSDGDAQEP
ncbi:MAG: hypothetical protein ACKO4V_01980 [Planctomycetota bacterium]